MFVNWMFNLNFKNKRMKKVLFFIICFLIYSLFIDSVQGAQPDSIVVVNGFVYNDIPDNPLMNAQVNIHQFDSLGNEILFDSILTDIEGKFTIQLNKGIYVFYPWIDGYLTMLYYSDIELVDSVHNLPFRLIRPEMSVEIDSIEIPDDFNETIERKVVLKNTGTGELVYSCAFYMDEEIPSS